MPSKTTLKVFTDDNIERAKEKLQWRNDNDNDSNSNPTKDKIGKKRESPKKSHGIPPSPFHHKRDAKANSWTRDLHTRVSQNLFLNAKEEHRQKLEEDRRAFKQITCIKRWPVQDMAMEHLDHLLEKKNAHVSFHGGENLSDESSSSTDSAEHTKRRTISSSPLSLSSPSSLSSPTQSGFTNTANAVARFENSNEPLWSLEPRIFATEKAQGKRKYLVGHFGRIADWYWRKAETKHLYEVIREQTPCRLYFDLEFSKVYNKHVDETTLLKEFQEEVVADLHMHFDLNFEAHENLIDLDSSTDVKFSRHWIFDLDAQGMFEDAPGVGRFVKRLVGRLAEELATGVLKDKRPELTKHLFVQTKDANKTSCFVDLGVYTRNRLFRVFGSSKFGKVASLQPADTNSYPIELPSKQPPTPKATLDEYIVANDWQPHARALADTLVVPLGGSEGCRILTVPEEDGARRAAGGLAHTSNNAIVQHPSFPRLRTAVSFLPALDRYVLDVLAIRGGVSGTIRALSVEYGPRDDPVSITYQLARNRYCELIGRSHKSNNVFWTVVLGGAWTCVQGCHDPECFGRGSPISIPNPHVKKIEEDWQAWQEEQFEKALMTLNLDDIVTEKASKSKTNWDDDHIGCPTSANNTTTTEPDLKEYEEPDFEQALLALDLDAVASSVEKKSDPPVVVVSKLPSSPDEPVLVDERQDEPGESARDDDSSVLSDTALLEAALSNPELFP